MKYPLLTILLCVTIIAFGQDKPLTKDDLKDRSGLSTLQSAGYQTSVPGWIVKMGDTLYLGKGTLPNKDFSFLYENPGSMMATYTSDYRLVRRYLPSSYSGRRVVLKDMGISGSKKIGFNIYGLVGVGNIIRYYVQLDDAIDAGEILPPPAFRKTNTSTAAPVSSVADELLKLKQLLDAGAITQQEYDGQKKKLLGQ